MVNVFVWLPVGSAWGHCSMYVQSNDPSQSRYISFWPLDYAQMERGDNPSAQHTYTQDLEAERREPHRAYRLNASGRHLDERAIVQRWDASKGRMAYNAATNNCCGFVAHLLQEVGGAERYSDWQPSGNTAYRRSSFYTAFDTVFRLVGSTYGGIAFGNISVWEPHDMVTFMRHLGQHIHVEHLQAIPTPPDSLS